MAKNKNISTKIELIEEEFIYTFLLFSRIVIPDKRKTKHQYAIEPQKCIPYALKIPCF